MDRVDKFFNKLIRNATYKCQEGQELFDRFDIPSNASGLVVRQYFTKYKYKGKYFILGWNIESTDGEVPRGIRTSASPYVQSYLVFNTEVECNKVLMYYNDKNYEIR